MRLSSFTRHSRSPVLLGHTEPDVIRVGGGCWYMFYRNDSTSKASIGLMSSSNGLDWTEHGRIYSATSSGFESAEVIAPTVLFENGTWYMWYEADDAAQPGRRRVGLATATNSINGPWTRRGIALNFFIPSGVRESFYHFVVALLPSGRRTRASS
jgi:GH43 family beta-xylosidase